MILKIWKNRFLNLAFNQGRGIEEGVVKTNRMVPTLFSLKPPSQQSVFKNIKLSTLAEFFYGAKTQQEVDGFRFWNRLTEKKTLSWWYTRFRAKK